MKNVFALTYPSGQVLADVTAITLVNNTVKTQLSTVTDDTLWAVMMIKMCNQDNVTRNVTINLWKEAAKTNKIGLLSYKANLAGGGGEHTYPDANYLPINPLVLGPGMTIECVWAAGGASTGSVDADGLVILYRKLPLT